MDTARLLAESRFALSLQQQVDQREKALAAELRAVKGKVSPNEFDRRRSQALKELKTLKTRLEKEFHDRSREAIARVASAQGVGLVLARNPVVGQYNTIDLTDGVIASLTSVREPGQREAANRPPSPNVLARNVVENVIRPETVKPATVDDKTGVASVTFASATFKPEQSKKDSREFLAGEARLAAQALLDRMPRVRRVNLTLVYEGATLATAVRTRGAKSVEVIYVDPRVK